MDRSVSLPQAAMWKIRQLVNLSIRKTKVEAEMTSFEDLKLEATQEFDRQVAQLFANDPTMNCRKATAALGCKYMDAYKSCIRQGIALKQGRH